MSGLVYGAGAIVLPADPTVQTSGMITQSGGNALYQVTIGNDGLLVAGVQTSGIDTLLSLQDDLGHTLIQGQAISPTNPNERIAQHLGAGTYYLSVSDKTGVGAFELSTTFTASTLPGAALSEAQGSYGVTTADVTGNGKSDIIVPDYYANQILINYGLGDGTFQAPVAIPVGTGPTNVLAADLSGDGHLDLVVVDSLSNDIMILEGDGQGNFQVSQVLSTGSGPVEVVAGHFSGGGSLDLAVAESGANGVQIFHNRGDGTFLESSFIGSISNPSALTVANVNGDGRDGLAVASSDSGNLVLLAGSGNDEFTSLPYQLPVGAGCADVIAANLSGGKVPYLAAVSPVTGKVSIFSYDGFAFRLRTTLEAGTKPDALVAADFNRDGHLDLAVANYGSNNVSIFSGKGNDTFGAATAESTGSGPIALAAGDFSGTGFTDLVTSDFIGLTYSVLLNNGDGTFRTPPLVQPSAGPQNVVVADLTGNGILDLVVPEYALDQVAIYLGRGDGTFRDAINCPAGSEPSDVAIGDFTGDGIPDLAISNQSTKTVTILQGNGDGTFHQIGILATGNGPLVLKSANLDGDGHLDLVVANYLDNTIDIFYGRGNGTFSDAVAYPVGLQPSGIAITELNGDGRLDIAVSNSGSNNVDVFMATGPRTYASPVSYATGLQPWRVIAADFNNDGHPDLMVSDGLASPGGAVSLLTGVGDGTFLPAVSFGVGVSPYAIAVGDFRGNGNLDAVTGNDGENTISVLLGDGKGTFQSSSTYAGGSDPYGVAVGDFTGNGRLDIVSVNYQSSDLSLFLGNGDGTFKPAVTIPLISPDLPTITADLEGNGVPQVLVANPQAGTITISNSQGDGTLQLLSTIQVGGSPSGMVVGDFNGDGRPDLAVTDASSGEVLIFLGLGDGTFESPKPYSVGQSPRSPVVGDFSKNGILDIAVADTKSNQVSILMGRGDGTFQTALNYPTGVEPISLYAGDLYGTGYLNLGVINRSSDDITAMLGLTGGNFFTYNLKIPDFTPSSLISGDFNGNGQLDFIVGDNLTGSMYVILDPAIKVLSDVATINVPIGKGFEASADLYHDGKSDLILANADTGVVTILSGWSNNTFANRYTFQVDVKIAGLSVVDLNNDGLLDLLITEVGTGQVETYLSGGNGVFSAAQSTLPLPHPGPIVLPVSSTGVSDIININNNGQILLRLGREGAVADFAAPSNQTAGTGLSFRDTTLVQTGSYPDVISLDSIDPLLYLVQTNFTGGPIPTTILRLPGSGGYTRLIAGDLFGTGLDDLIVINKTSDELVIFQQTSSNVFSQYGEPIPAGFGPTDVSLAYITPGALPELVVTDGSSGEVTLIGRNSQGGFVVSAMLPAGLATAGTILLPSGLQRTSPDVPVGVTSGVFGTSGLADVVVVDYGTDRISILQGLPDGGLAAPSLAFTYSTGLNPIQVVAAPLTRNGLLDLVVLNEGSNNISIFLNNGHGGFTAMAPVDAGDQPKSLAVSEVTGDGLPDLVVSNASGDVLILAGNGNGSFQPYQRADGTVNLAVGDLTGSGQNTFVLTNTAQDLLSVQGSSSSAGFIQGRSDGLIAPGPVAIADLRGNGISDLIVVNTGGNDVFVYLGLGNGQFAAPQRFFTGTAPIGLTVANLTTSGLPDLIVANSGSNDITILLGTTEPDGTWTMVPGPRLKVGDRPVSTTVAEVNGVEDIIVVNQDSNTVTLLGNLGNGFFRDHNALTLATGLSPVQAFVGYFSSTTSLGLVVLNSLSNNMTYYSSALATAQTIGSGGIDPISGVMGFFNNDKYSDLAVANNGDSRITLFDGGPTGLTLSQTITLGNSTRPTDLVVSTTTTGDVQFYVGAEGQDHAIPVSFASISTSQTIVAGPTDSGQAGSGDLAHLSAGSGSNSSESRTAIFEATGNALSPQVQESAQAGTQSASGNGAASLAAAAITTLTQAIQPLFAPSSRTLGWLIDNLVQLAQGQTAEILPLGQNELAAVAVLLSASSIADPLQTSVNSPLPISTEDDIPIVASSIRDDDGTASPAPLDRFVADLGAFSVDFSQGVFDPYGRGREFSSEWVWHRQSTDASASTATFEARQESGLSVPHADKIPVDATRTELGPPLSENGHAESFGESGPSLLAQFAITLAAIVATGVGVIVARRLDRGTFGNLLNRRLEHDSRETTPVGIKVRERVGATSSSPKHRAMEDLPPWLNGSMSRRDSPAILPNRSFAATILRNCGRGE